MTELEHVKKFLDNPDRFQYPETKKKGKKVKISKEKQHYVAKAYLKHFSDDGFVYVYDIQKQGLNPDIVVSIDDIMKKRNLYTFTDTDGETNFIIEKRLFAEFLEGNIKNVVDKLLAHKDLNEEDWKVLSGFVCFQCFRTTSQIDKIRMSGGQFMKLHRQNYYPSFEVFEKKRREREVDHPKQFKHLPTENLREIYNDIKKGEYTIEQSHESAMVDAIKLGNDSWELFLNAHYEVLETRKSGKFITSDCPFFIIPPKGRKYTDYRGIGLVRPPVAEKIFPINEKQCLRIWLSEEKKRGISISYKTINHKEMLRINSYICKNAERFIVSKDKHFLEEITKDIDFSEAEKAKKRDVEYVKISETEGFIVDENRYPL